MIADDEEFILQMLHQCLVEKGYSCQTVTRGDDVLTEMEKRDYPLLLTDLNMPGLDGFQVLRAVRQRDRETAVIVITGEQEIDRAVQCMKEGAYDYLTKPFHKEQLLLSVERALERRRHRLRERDYHLRLEEEVRAKTQLLEKTIRQLQATKQQLEGRVEEIITRLSLAGEYRDEDTGRHVQRIAVMSTILAQGMNLSNEFCEMVRIASPLHDVGKIGISDTILLKPGRFTEQEMELMKQHTLIGARILQGSNQPVIHMAHTIALSHHEKYNGKGYPKQLAGTEIPLAGRIVAVADVFDALSSERPYKKAWPSDEAMEFIRNEREKHFDPDVVDVFIDQFDTILKTRERVNFTTGEERTLLSSGGPHEITV